MRQAMIEQGIVVTIAKALSKQSHALPVVLMHYLATMAALSCSKFERGIEAKMLQEGALEILQVTGRGLSDSSASMKGGPAEPISLANMLGARTILNLTTCFDERTTYDHAVELITECISRLTQYMLSSASGITAVRGILVQALCNISRYENNRARMISQGVVGTLFKSDAAAARRFLPPQPTSDPMTCAVEGDTARGAGGGGPHATAVLVFPYLCTRRRLLCLRYILVC